MLPSLAASLAVAVLILTAVDHSVEAYQCWTQWDKLTTPRGFSCPALVEQTAYLLGGATGFGAAVPASSVVSISVDNPLQWELTAPDLPQPMMGGSFCAYEGTRLYVAPTAADMQRHDVTQPTVYLLDTVSGAASGGGTGGSGNAASWVSLGQAPTARRYAAIGASFIAPHIFIFGGLGADGNPVHVVDVYNESAGEWQTGATMPTPGCNCRCASHFTDIYLLCEECSAINRTSTNTSVTFNFMRFHTTTMSFTPLTFSFSTSGTLLSLQSVVMGQFFVSMATFSDHLNPVNYYTDLFTGRTMAVTSRYISSQRSHGAIIPMTTNLMYAGGQKPVGDLSVEVDIVPVLPSITVSVSNVNRTYEAGTDVVIKSLTCPPGFTIRLATTPRCDVLADGTQDGTCTVSMADSFTYIPTSTAVSEAFVCVSLGVCSADVDSRLPCNNTGQGTNDNFENCIFNACCWDDDLQMCYAFSDGPAASKFFFSVDADPVVIAAPPQQRSRRSELERFLNSPAGVASIVCGALVIVIALFTVAVRSMRRVEEEPGSQHPLDQHSRYRVLCKLGQGGFGTVFLVARKSDGHKFALKYIVCKDEEERDYAIKEFELIRNAQGHPNMITMVDMFMNWSENTEFAASAKSVNSSASEISPLLQLAPKYVCIVMDYCPEGDLCHYVQRQRLAGNRISEEFALNVFARQCCELLMHLHALEPPIVHRDLKTENILISQNAEQIIVTDFGLAQQVERSYMTTRAGSLHYAAPELWKRHYTSAIDCWAVGCIIYAICTGRVTADTARVMFSDVRERGFEDDIRHDLRDYSPKLHRVVLGLLKADPNKRWTSTRVIQELDAVE